MTTDSFGTSSPTPEPDLEAQIKRDLCIHLDALGFQKDIQGLLRPRNSTKECFKALHLAQRRERLRKEAHFIERSWPSLRRHFANGTDVKPERIVPRLELIRSDTWESDLFRLAALTWSVPVSQGYGRRMRFLAWDDSNGKLIGIFALGDPVFNLRVRDEWIGWTLKDREERLVNLLDAYVLGSVPPYSFILGGKLVASLIRTREVRDAFAARYRNARGVISRKKKHAALCLVTTTSALGRSSVYNRLALNGSKLFIPIGYTAGWGHFHIPDELFSKMRAYLESVGDEYANNHRFGDGPNWKLRVVRKALATVGVDADLMHHGIPREVFACPIASNAQAFLTGRAEKPRFDDLERVEAVSEAAIARWVIPRAQRRSEFLRWKGDGIYCRLQSAEDGEPEDEALPSASGRN